MNQNLTIQEKLKDLRVAKGLTTEQLSQATGISKSALNTYENSDTKDISHFNLVKLARYYDVSTDYLLGIHDNIVHTNTQIGELRLSDAMIDMLKEGRFNHRLLSEIVTHPEFANFLADIELYVDGLASMQVHNLNVWVDAAREEIVARHNPPDDDPTMRILNSAHIIEDDYFQHLIHSDIDQITKDIREAHKTDSTSAPSQTNLPDLKKHLNEIADFKGSEAQKLIMIFCQQTQLNYNKLTEEEKNWLVKIANKSNLLRKGVSQRGKGKKYN